MRTEPTLVSRALRWLPLVLASSLAACGDGDPTVDNNTLDRTAPSVSVVRATSADSVFAFTVNAENCAKPVVEPALRMPALTVVVPE